MTNTSKIQLLYREGRFAESLAAIKRCIQLRGEQGPAGEYGPRWWYRAMLLARAGDHDQAHEYYEILVDELANDPASNLAENEIHRRRLAELLGISEPPPYSLD